MCAMCTDPSLRVIHGFVSPVWRGPGYHQSFCFLPILWNLHYFKKALKILHWVVLFSHHSHCKRKKWLEEYLIVPIPSSMVLAMSHHKLIFYSVHNGLQFGWKYFTPEFLLDFSWMSWSLWTTECLLRQTYFVNFLLTRCLIPLQSTVSWNLKYCCWHWQMP